MNLIKIAHSMFNDPSTKWKSRIVALAAASGTIAAVAIANGNGFLDLISKLQGIHSEVVVQITSINLQFPNHDRVAIRIGNPKSTKEGFAEFLLECERTDGTSVFIHAWNDTATIPPMPNSPPVRGTPLNVDAGATDALTLAFWKQRGASGIGVCKKVSMNWIDNTGKMQHGVPVLIPPGAVFVSFTNLKGG